MAASDPHPAPATPQVKPWVAMLVENEPYPADVRVRREAETLTAAGYRVTVVAPRGGGEARTERLEGVEVSRFWLPQTQQNVPGFLLEYAIAHLQLAARALLLLAQGVRILHLNNPPDTLSPLLLLARGLGRRTVFDNHDLFPELFEVRYRSRWLVRMLRLFQKLAFRTADLVLTTNESQREIVLKAVRRPRESVVVVRNGPPASEIPSRANVRTRGIHERAPLELLFVGALEPQDGIVSLAEVLELLLTKHRLPSRLTVVGEGSCRSVLAAEARRRGVEERISFTGRIPHDEVPGWLQKADICLDPAPCNQLNHASTMIKIAEYMAAGKPVVAFDLRETRQTAGDSALYARCGQVEDFAAKIAQLALDPRLGEELVGRAQERLPSLYWERSGEALLKAYSSLGA